MTHLIQKAQAYLRTLCVDIASRAVGSEGNRAATDFFARTVNSFRFTTQSHQFPCMDWRQDGVFLTVDGVPFQAFASPYTLGCRVTAPLAVVGTIEELNAAHLADRIAFLHGDVTKEQLMPKNFPFYNPDHHRRLIRLLEEKRPLAIIAATTRDAVMVGSQYPFPLIEDGDFDIPSVYMSHEEASRLLAAYSDRSVSLDIRAERIPAVGYNVIARTGAEHARRVVIFAHIDAKRGSPGALDNAGGVVILLLLAELLADYFGKLGIELVALNGEDYFSNPGEQQYLALNAGRFHEIVLGINLDGAGYHRGSIAYSLYDCPPPLADAIRGAFSCYPEMTEGEPWYQGDHGLFLLNQRPALALTSEVLTEASSIIHTSKDTPSIIAADRLVAAAQALRDLLLTLAH